MTAPRVLVTRAAEGSARLADLLRDADFDPVEVPAFVTHPGDEAGLADALRRMAGGDPPDDAVFTSPTAVRVLVDLAESLSLDLASALAPTRVSAVGDATAQTLADAGVRVDVIPDAFDGDALVVELVARGLAGRRVFFPRNAEGRAPLLDRICAAGASLDAHVAYRVSTTDDLPERLAAAIEGGLWAVTAASSNTLRRVDAAAEACGRANTLRGLRVAAIGERTAATAQALGYVDVRAASPSTLPGLVATLRGWWKEGRG